MNDFVREHDTLTTDRPALEPSLPDPELGQHGNHYIETYHTHLDVHHVWY